MRKQLLAAVAMALFLAAAAAAQLATKRTLTLDAAKKIAAAAEAEAVKNKWNVVIAVLDDSGKLIYLQRMDGTQIGSVDVAIAKAESAFKFRRPTKAFEDALAGGRQAIMMLPGAMPVEGGLPLTVDGNVIGAIGVSGVTSQQDAQIGSAGAAALAKMAGN
jgi:glc operon protein GlcG